MSLQERRFISRPNGKRSKTSPDGLPDDVVEIIFSYLSAKDATRFSVLSKRFVSGWRLSRNLAFGRDLAKKHTKEELIAIINRFLHDQVNVKLNRFHLYFDPTDSTGQVCSWINTAIRCGITELDLDFSSSKNTFILSAFITNIYGLNVLKLNKCEVDFIPNFKGLCCLMHVSFENVRVLFGTLQSVFCHCPMLTTMELTDCNFYTSLRIWAQNLTRFRSLVVRNRVDIETMCITAPSLESFHYHGKNCAIRFDDEFPNLEDVVLNFTQPRTFQVLVGIKEMLPTLTRVTTLTVSSPFLEAQCAKFRGDRYWQMVYYLENLKELHLVVGKESYVNPLDVPLLLNNCPFIERVFIDLQKHAFGGGPFWDTVGRRTFLEFNPTFFFMKSAKIKGFAFKDMHLLMATMFLKNAPNLQTLVLVKAKDEHTQSEQGIGQEICADSRTKVFEYLKDKSALIPFHSKLSR